jgi:hypothetical protein
MDASHASAALYAYPKKGLISALAIASGTVTLLSFWGMIALLQMENMPPGATVFGCALLASPAYFIGKLTLRYIHRLLRNGPEIAIDSDGLFLAYHSKKTIAWDNIQRVELSRFAHNIVGVWLIDPALDPPLRKRGWFERRTRHQNDTGDLLFGIEAMTVSVGTVMTAIAFHLPTVAPTRSKPIAAPYRQ